MSPRRVLITAGASGIGRATAEAFDAAGIATVHAAFSRESEAKTYVQDLITREADQVWAMIEAGARIYICGDGAKMEPDVRRALTTICAEKRGCSPEEAADWIDAMIDEERYLLDVWVG